MMAYDDNNGNYEYINQYGQFWSSTEATGANAWYRKLIYNNSAVYRYNNYLKQSGFSVRCLMD